MSKLGFPGSLNSCTEFFLPFPQCFILIMNGELVYLWISISWYTTSIILPCYIAVWKKEGTQNRSRPIQSEVQYQRATAVQKTLIEFRDTITRFRTYDEREGLKKYRKELRRWNQRPSKPLFRHKNHGNWNNWNQPSSKLGGYGRGDTKRPSKPMKW